MSDKKSFDAIFDKYRKYEDKQESLYIFIINNISYSDAIDKINKIMTSLDQIQNNYRKNYLKNRIYNFITYLDNFQLENVVKGIFLVSNEIDRINLDDYWILTLKMYSCDNFYYCYDNFFKIDWLYSFLVDRSYINIINIKNNDVKHVHLSKFKKNIIFTTSSKTFDINEYINNNIEKNIYCIIHGNSHILKIIKEKSNIKVLNTHYNDDELTSIHTQIINDNNIIELKTWLSKLLDPKDGKKIVFGKDIQDCILSKLIKTVFCIPTIKNKLLKKLSSDYIIFDIVEIDPVYNDIGKILEKDYMGIIGIKFY